MNAEIGERLDLVNQTIGTQVSGTNGRPDSESDALTVSGAVKVFGGSPRFWWLSPPALKRRLGGEAAQVDEDEEQATRAVDGVSFTVRRGEIFGVLGPNGGGKSTLIRLIATLLIPDEGEIRIFDHDVVDNPMAAQQLINRVSVEASFFKKLSPMENLLYGARLYGVSGAEIRTKVVDILDRLDIPKKNVHRPMEQMSRGMQQKVAIARALLSTPILLLLDEPTTGLDPRSKHEVQAFVRELRDQHDTTILLTTHDMVEADTLCDRVAIMDSGQIVALDTPANLKLLARRRNGNEPTLEDVFLELTGKKLIKESDLPA